MKPIHKKILIIADIEGSSGCLCYDDTLPFRKGWPRACAEMSRDVNSVVQALFDAGADEVTVKDFHRTGYNLIPGLVDRRARLIHGYRKGPVPGIGEAHGYTGLIMTGMHAPSGYGDFLSHTMTSRIARIELNGRLLSEAELFSASLASYGAGPLLISGTAGACDHAREALTGIRTYPLERGPDFDPDLWRRSLALEAGAAIYENGPAPYMPQGPFEAILRMRDGEAAARKHAAPWGFLCQGDSIILRGDYLNDIYYSLIRLCYLSPAIERFLAPSLKIYNALGYIASIWARLMLTRKRIS